MDYSGYEPALVGAYAVAGIFIMRTVRGTSSPPDWMQIAVVAGTSAAAAALAPMGVKFITCPKSDSAPLVEAGISTALSWGMLGSVSSFDDAAMFAPIQLGSHLLAQYVVSSLEKNNHSDEAEAAYEQ